MEHDMLVSKHSTLLCCTSTLLDCANNPLHISCNVLTLDGAHTQDFIVCLMCLFELQAVDSWRDPESPDKSPPPSPGWDIWYGKVESMPFIAGIGANAWTPLGRR